MAKESTDDLKKAQSKASGPESHGAAMLSDAKANDFNKAVKNLVDYLKNEKFKVLLVVAFAIIGTVLSILGPKILAGATNKIQNYVIKDQIYSQIQKIFPRDKKFLLIGNSKISRIKCVRKPTSNSRNLRLNLKKRHQRFVQLRLKN